MRNLGTLVMKREGDADGKDGETCGAGSDGYSKTVRGNETVTRKDLFTHIHTSIRIYVYTRMQI